MTSTLIKPSPAAQTISLFQSILLSLGQSINHGNALYISNNYMNVYVNLDVQDDIRPLSPNDPLMITYVLLLFIGFYLHASVTELFSRTGVIDFKYVINMYVRNIILHLQRIAWYLSIKMKKMVKGHICCHVKHNLELLLLSNACCGTYTQ